jgi:predicted nucleotidyltransferase
VGDGDLPLKIVETASATPGLTLLLLFGSRARGDAGTASDWDFGYIGSGIFDPDRLLPVLLSTLGSDRVDLVDLQRAGGLLRFRAARDGRPVYEAEPDAFARFWLDAVLFWCDVAPIVQRGYDAILAELPR